MTNPNDSKVYCGRLRQNTDSFTSKSGPGKALKSKGNGGKISAISYRNRYQEIKIIGEIKT